MRRVDSVNDQVAGGEVVVYARFSSDHQRPSSIDDQVAECRRYAERLGLPMPTRVVKDEGVSVKEGMAPSFEKLLGEARAGRVSGIYVDELSRISRVTADVLNVQRVVRFREVRLWAVLENIEVTDEHADIHVIFAGHKNQVASRDARHRVKRSMDGNMTRGLSNGDLKLGYKSVALTDEEAKQLGLRPRAKDERPYKRLVVDKAQAAIVRRIFQLYVVEKKTIRGIASVLNEERVPRGGKVRTKRWRQIDVRNVLISRRYLGYRWRNLTKILTDPDTGGKAVRPQAPHEYIETHDPALAIIDRETFDAAQRRLDANRAARKARLENAADRRRGDLMAYAPRKLLSGTLVCGECGASLVQRYAQKVAYYVCPNAQCKLCKNTVQTRRDLVHTMVLDAIIQEAEPDYLIDQVHNLLVDELAAAQSDVDDDLRRLERRRADLTGEVDNLTSAIARNPNSDALFNALRIREQERRELELQIEEARHRKAAPIAPPPREWVERHLRRDLHEIVDADVGRAAHLLRAITGPIHVYAGQKPWLQTRYPIARFSLDFGGLTTAVASDEGDWHGEPGGCGFGTDVELEVRTVPIYERIAGMVVRLRDEKGLSWPAIACQLAGETSVDNLRIAYRFGKTGSPRPRSAVTDAGA